MSRRTPARFFRASALGVVAVGLLAPATASAQGPVLGAPVFQPVFQPGPTAESGNGPIVSLLHGHFDAGTRETVLGVSKPVLSGDGNVPAGVALFGETSGGYDRTEREPLAGDTPVAAVAARIDDTDRESAIVVGRQDDAGVLESFDWHANGTLVHRVIPLGQMPAGVAVGRFLPGHGTLVAVSLDGGQVAFYAPTEDGFVFVTNVAGIPAGPLATSGTSPDGRFDTLITRAASDGMSGVRTIFSASDDVDPVYSASDIGGTSRPFGASNGRIAQDQDVLGQTWFASDDGNTSSLSWLAGGSGYGEMPAGGPFLASAVPFDAPVVLDLFGHGQRDAVAALDGETIAARSVTTDETVAGPFWGGRVATAIDIDGDRRDEIAAASSTSVTLFFNRTGAKETTPDVPAAALEPSVHSAAADVQIVTSRHFDLVVPTDTDDRYECAVDDGGWVPCSDGTHTALSVTDDGDYTVRVRRMVAGTTFWSDEQTIAVSVDTSAPAAPTLLESPSGLTRYPYFRVAPVDGVRYEFRVDGHGDWAGFDTDFELSNVPDGPHRVTIRAVDAVRNVPSDGVDVDLVLDTVAPGAPVKLAGPEETTTKRTAVIGFDGEPDGTYECLVDTHEPTRPATGTRTTDPWTPCDSPLVLTDLALGPHTVTVRQTDKAGNRGPRTTWTWTVVEPDPEPVVDTPAPAEPESTQPAVTEPAVTEPTPTSETTPAPAATPAPAPAPAPVQDAAKPVGRTPVAAKLTVGAAAGKGKTPTATATGRRVAVGCAAPGAKGYRCAVTVTRGGKKVGEGRRTGAGVVPVNLDKATARKVQRLGGLKVRVTLTVKTADGTTTKTQKTVRILPKKVLVVPTDGLFAFDSATPSRGADALAKQIAGQLDGARRITIVGHTDAQGSADVNRRLGRRRAEAFRRLLAKHGFDGAVSVESAGDTHPRASNATAGGRALNRRVEIEVRY
jgi:outer membrane protein OmpA-like peptidoglycan-associated protein